MGLALALRLVLLAADVIPFNSDEAVVGLMARHILRGERPIFFQGQAYLGSLDAWLVAGAFVVGGESVLVMRLVQTALYLGVIVTAYALACKIYARRWIAPAAALFLAVPTVLVTLYTTATLGGYGETLLIGNALLWLALHLGASAGHASSVTHKGPAGLWLLFGLLSGLGFWTFPLICVYVLPALIYLLTIYRSRLLRSSFSLYSWPLFTLGFLLGASPWLWFTATYGLTTVAELGGSAIAGASGFHPVWSLFAHLFNFLLFGLTVIFGLRPPWSAEFLALPLAPLALVVYSALIVSVTCRVARSRRRPNDAARAGRGLLVGVCLTLVAAFILTPFGADPSGRYFLPLVIPLALLLAEMLDRQRQLSPGRRWLAHGLALSLILFNLWGTVHSAAQFPPGLTTQFDAVAQVNQRDLPALMAFLRAQGETRGYTNYWVEFPLAYLSDEELIYEARLPYHLDFRYTPRDNRYPPYAQVVADSLRVAYITTRHPPLEERLRTGLTQLGVAFQEQQIGDFHIFYALSRKVVPEELGLGVACCTP